MSNLIGSIFVRHEIMVGFLISGILDLIKSNVGAGSESKCRIWALLIFKLFCSQLEFI